MGRVVYGGDGNLLTLIIPEGGLGGGNGYIGRYEVEGDVIVHIVDTSTNPSYEVGLRLERTYSLEDGMLSLTAEDGTVTLFTRLG